MAAIARTLSLQSNADVSAALAYARAHRRDAVQELQRFIRFPSVSAQTERRQDVRRCAAWLENHLQRIGLEKTKVIPTARHPIVYAEWRHAPARPTVLIYGHYDVQPVDPLSDWRSPPFNPAIRGEYLFGRGASDDKGQLFAHVKAIEAFLHTRRALPVNVRCLFEGEEEIGSPHLHPFIWRNRRQLAADAAVISDTRMLAPDRPVITYALRGQLSLELEVKGPGHDLHSGNFGGAVHGPLEALSEILSTLHDKRGRISIPGIYSGVRIAGEKERTYLASVAPSDEDLLREAGASAGWGEQDYSLYERTTLRPAVTINGITGGYQGPGAKAVIPARAVAKLNFRLVPDQDPAEVERVFRKHVAHVAPSEVQYKITTLAQARPAVVPRAHPAVRAAARAYKKGFGAPPVFLRSSGTIPVVDTFLTALRMPTVLMGFGLPGDNIHAPNERFYLPNFFRGIETVIWFLDALGRT
jgi:acetylornithine deacetylase/succinyl-diaminopimelate desuccinylase-like protein